MCVRRNAATSRVQCPPTFPAVSARAIATASKPGHSPYTCPPLAPFLCHGRGHCASVIVRCLHGAGRTLGCCPDQAGKARRLRRAQRGQMNSRCGTVCFGRGCCPQKLVLLLPFAIVHASVIAGVCRGMLRRAQAAGSTVSVNVQNSATESTRFGKLMECLKTTDLATCQKGTITAAGSPPSQN